MDWKKYNDILGFDLDKYTQENPKDFFMNYKYSDIGKEDKSKMELLLSIAKDINNVKIDGNFSNFASSDQAGEYFQNRIGLDRNEKFEVAYLDKNFRKLETQTIGVGNINSALVDFRAIVDTCINTKGIKHIISAHNHPSGDPKPSSEDLSLERVIQKTLNRIGVNYLDNIIVTHEDHISIKQNVQYGHIEKENSPKELDVNLLSNAQSNKILERNQIDTLKLEEKISLLTELSPTKIKGVFQEKEVNDLSVTKKAKGVLDQIYSFSKDLRASYNIKIGSERLGSCLKVIENGKDMKIESKNQMGIIFANTKLRPVGSKVYEVDNDKDFMMKILKDAIKHNAINIFMVSRDKNKDNYETNNDYSKFKDSLQEVQIDVIDYVNYVGSDDWYSGRGKSKTWVANSGNMVKEPQLENIESPKQPKVSVKSFDLEI